jgi:dephospho-CoA kinase
MTMVLGLTGSIGMGKSTTARMFSDLRVPVHDADAAVHELYRAEAVKPVAALFPDAVDRDEAGQDSINRERLSKLVLGHPERLAALEAVVHPLVREREQAFLRQAWAAGSPLVVLDIPLLFESGGAARCDAVAVVTAPLAVQRSRVLARPGMTEARFEAIQARQMPDADKRARATYIIDTGKGLDHARAQVAAIVASVSSQL